MLLRISGLTKQVFRQFSSNQGQQKIEKQQSVTNINESWIRLLRQEVQWSTIQNKVQTAALLTCEIDKVGWYVQPANTSEKALTYIDSYYKHTYDIELKSQSLDSIIKEFIDLFIKFKNVKLDELPKISKVDTNVLLEVNEFLNSRGQKQEWRMDQYLDIVNHNFRLLTQEVKVQNLPSNEEVSIELLYGYMISHYGLPFLNACPQIAVFMVSIPFVNANRQSEYFNLQFMEPKKQKLNNLQLVINNKKNLPFDEQFYQQKFKDVFELSQQLKDQKTLIEQNKSKYSKKSMQRLKKLIRVIDGRFSVKQERYEVRQEIVSQQYEIKSDYLSFYSKGWEVLFYQGIKQGLNRLPTSIVVYNNATLRNPSKHLVTRFLYSQNNSLREHLMDQLSLSQEKLEQYCLLVRRARKQNYINSDWQNKIARKWSQLRSQILKHIQYQNEKNNGLLQINRVPPPFQYCLALDLNPESHPFSFTYRRNQGYCINLQESLIWFIRDCNPNEKDYFYSLLENPNCDPQFEYLKEIPEAIRKPPKQFVSEEDEEQYILEVNQWLEENSQREDLQIIKRINQFIDQKLELLRKQYLKDKAIKMISQRISIVSLFDSILKTHFPEEIYLSKINLIYPKYRPQNEEQELKQDKIFQPINPLVFNSPQELLGFWGPPQYGGHIQDEYFF